MVLIQDKISQSPVVDSECCWWGEDGGIEVSTVNISPPLVSKYPFTTRCSIVILHIALNIKDEKLNFSRKWTTKASKFFWSMLLQLRPD